MKSVVVKNFFVNYGLYILILIVSVVAIGISIVAFTKKCKDAYSRSLMTSPDAPLDLTKMYKLLAGKSYALVEHAPTYLNIAMSDFVAEYWMTSTAGAGTLRFDGTFPSWAIYSALTAYDTQGGTISNYNAFQFHGRHVSLEFTSAAPMVVLMRVYRPKGVTWTPEKDFFTVYSNDVKLHVAPRWRVKMRSKLMTPILQALMPIAKKAPGMPFQVSGHATTMRDVGFVNEDAGYCWSIAPATFLYGEMTYLLPESAEWRPYIGVMACDGRTSRTDASVGMPNIGGTSVKILFLSDGAPSPPGRWDYTLKYSSNTTIAYAIVRILNVSAYGEYDKNNQWGFYEDYTQRNPYPLELANSVVRENGLTPQGLQSLLGSNTPQIFWH